MQEPHDSIVKALFANTEDAASALASALPPEIASRIDWSTLEHANLNLVDRKLRKLYSDVVFKARLEGREVVLYVLLEHQSTGHPLMPFRMLRYVVQILGRPVERGSQLQALTRRAAFRVASWQTRLVVADRAR